MGRRKQKIPTLDKFLKDNEVSYFDCRTERLLPHETASGGAVNSVKLRIAYLQKVHSGDFIVALVRDGQGFLIAQAPTLGYQARLDAEYKTYRAQLGEPWPGPYEYRRQPGPRRTRRNVRKPELDEFDSIEVRLVKPRPRHQKGWKNSYVPTKQRYWRPTNNNWKRRRQTQWRQESR